MDKIDQMVDALNQEIAAVQNTSTHGAYSKFFMLVNDMEVVLREYIQDRTVKDVQKIVEKLLNKTELSPQEIEFVRMWIVGDADHYVSIENNLTDWQEEVARLQKEINAMREGELNVTKAFKLRALMFDLMRTLSNINHYLQQKERIHKFEEATRELDADERKLLADLLLRKMESPKY